MRPIKLTFQGLRSYRRETTIDFSDLDLFAVIGDTGAGKSTILEALCLALYAKKSWSGGSLSQLIADGESAMQIRLTFSAGGHEWEVTRRRGSSSIDKLVSPSGGGSPVDGADLVTGRIEELVGLDFDQFTRAVVLPQGRFDQMLQASETVRNQLLTSILDLGDVVGTREKAEKVLRAMKPRRDRWLGERSSFPRDPQAAVEEARREVGAAKVRGDELEETTGKVRRLNDRVKGLPDAARELSRRLAGVGDIDEAAVAELRGFSSRWRELVKQQTNLHKELKGAAEELRHLEERESRALDGFERRDDLVRTLTGIEVAVEELPLRQMRRVQLAQRLDELRSSPPSDEVAPKLLALDQSERARLTGAEELLTAAETDLGSAKGLWIRVSDARDDCAKANDAWKCAVEALEKAERKCEGLQPLVQEAEEAVEACERRLRAAEIEDAAATAAAECEPGDACPVCSQELPKTFVRPQRSTDVEALDEALKRARDELKGLRGRSAEAEAERRLRDSEVKRSRNAAALAATKQRNAEADAVQGGCEPGAETLESAVAALVRARDEARAEREAAKTRAEGATAAVVDAERELLSKRASHNNEIGAAAKQLSEVEQWLSDRRKDLEKLPNAWKLRAGDAELVERAQRLRNLLRETLHSLDEMVETRKQLDQDREELKVRLDSVREAVDAEKVPAADIIREVQTYLASTEDVLGTASVAAKLLGEDWEHAPAGDGPSTPSDPDDLDAKVEILSKMLDRASEVLSSARAVLEACENRLAEADAQRRKLLDGVGCETTDELHQALGSAKEELRAASRRVKEAEQQARDAASLDEKLAIAVPFVANLTVLTEALRDRQFIAHLVDARERELLGEASRRLRDITKGRFAFVADFGVVSVGSGEVRSPNQLSGGERFQASLALALALVEIASRGGGRLDAVFIDEGFASLDNERLDDALETLGRVAKGGKMVGLITHEAQVAAYVDSVLRVTKHDLFGSEITMLDADAQEELLADDIRSGLSA